MASRHSNCQTYLILFELEHRQVLQNVVLDACSVLCADPVLSGGPHKPLSAVFILDTALVASQVTVDVTEMYQYITVVALQTMRMRFSADAELFTSMQGMTKGCTLSERLTASYCLL